MTDYPRDSGTTEDENDRDSAAASVEADETEHPVGNDQAVENAENEPAS